MKNYRLDFFAGLHRHEATAAAATALRLSETRREALLILAGEIYLDPDLVADAQRLICKRMGSQGPSRRITNVSS